MLKEQKLVETVNMSSETSTPCQMEKLVLGKQATPSGPARFKDLSNILHTDSSYGARNHLRPS